MSDLSKFPVARRRPPSDPDRLGWVRNLIGFYDARSLVAFDELQHVPGWLERGLARPAVQRGLALPKRP